MFLPRIPFRPAALALSIAMLVAPAFAETEAASESEVAALGTVTVTAQKRAQQIEDVPIAITAYSGEFLEQIGVSGFEDLGAFVPGLEIQVQSPNNPGFVIRGITSDSGAANVEPRVSVFQDGVSISRSRASIVELHDIERVEVLRGPQGTLFGRAAQIGAVHIIQNKAQDRVSSQLRIGAGNFDERLVSGHLNTPFTDNVYGRVAFFHRERDGFLENLSGGALNGKDTSALRSSFRLDLGGLDGFDLILNWQKDTPPGTSFKSGSIPTRRGDRDPFAPADLTRGAALGLDRTVYGATLLGNLRLTDTWGLSTISGWRRFKSLEEFDADGSQVFVLEFAEQAEGKQFSQELRFDYDDGGAFSGFVGTGYFREDGFQGVPFRTDERSLFALISPLLAPFGIPTIPLLNPDGTPNTSFAINPITGTPLKPFHEERFENYGKVSAFELFADGSVRVTERTELTAGLRATRERITAGYRADFFGVPSSIGVIPLAGAPAFPNALFQPTPGRLGASDRFSSMVGRLVARQEFDPGLSGYASIARGRRPNVINVDAAGSEVIKDEIVLSYEIGAKAVALGGRLQFDAALYYYDYSNFQASVENPNPPPFFVTVDAGNARARGFETTVFAELAEGLNAFANYGWIDARFNAFDDDGNPQVLAGNRFRLTPEHSASAGLNWTVPLDGGRLVYLRPNWNWRSSVFFEEDNDPLIRQGGYALYNLRAGILFDGGRWDLGAYVSNAFNKRYLIDAGNTGALFGTPTFIAGPPRFYGVQLTGRF